MKTIQQITLGAFILTASLNLSSCKSKQDSHKADAPKGEIEINYACSGSDFFSNKKNFRANSVGESMDQATSKKKALSDARTYLASSIQTTIKATIDNYVNSREVNNKEQVEERFEGLSREVINQKLSGVKTICERTFKDQTTGNYKTYLAIEYGADELVEAINDRLTKDESLKVDYDYEKFKKTFDKEMEKLEKGN